MTRTISLVLVLVTATTVGHPALSHAANEVCGDFSNNGSVGASDALILLKFAVGQPLPIACPASNAVTADLAARIDALEQATSCMHREADETIFDGCNVHIRSGAGATDAPVNALGNLIVGYNESVDLHDRTGSHNIIVGTEQDYSSYGGLVAGISNAITAPYSTVTGGSGNEARGPSSSVSGGSGNLASADNASVSGGNANKASGPDSSVSGGIGNTASESASAVSGGNSNTASGFSASVSGGSVNTASGFIGAVGGGHGNTASGDDSSVSGGFCNLAGPGQQPDCAVGLTAAAHVSGGFDNWAHGNQTVVSGGNANEAAGTAGVVSGGVSNHATAGNATVGGGASVTNNAGSTFHAQQAGGFPTGAIY